MGGDWLNKDDTIEGFEWRNGTDGVTHGIQIWSKPFIFENKSKEKVWNCFISKKSFSVFWMILFREAVSNH